MNKRLENRIFIGFFCCWLLVGAVVFFVSITRIVISVRRTGHYAVTQGRVVSSLVTEETELADGRLVTRQYHTPVIEYEVGGKIYQIKGELQSELMPAAGIPVSIRYNPQNPEEAIFGSKLFSRDFSLLFFGFGVCVMALFILSMEIETPLFARFRLTLLCLAFGTAGGGTYLYMGNNIGSFNPFIMIYTTPWSIIPCLFLALVGLVLFFSIKNIIVGIRTR